MASTRLVSFLGLGRFDPDVKQYFYETTAHRWPDERLGPPTPYICRSLAQFLGAGEIEVLATQEAEDAHADRLVTALRDANLPRPRFHRMPKGETSQELWEQFEVVKEQLRAPSGTEVALDVTHAFRSQPFFAAAVTAFVRAVDSAPAPLRVFYAAFEARKDDVAPVWELTPFIELLDWTQAIMLFLRTGRSAGVAEHTIEFGDALARRWAAAREGPPPRIKELGRELQLFGGNIETVRTGALLVERRNGSAASVAVSVVAARESAAALPLLREVLDRLESEMLAPLLGAGEHLANEEGHRALVSLARLYRRMGRWAEAAAVVREGWITRYAFPEAALGLREGTRARVDRAARDQAEARWFASEGHVADDAARVRNDIEHAGFVVQPLNADALREQIGKRVEDFAAAPAPSAAAAEARGHVFVNLSNHPHAGWSEAQRTAALALAPEIHDLPFPAVPPEAGPAEVTQLCEGVLGQIPAGASHALVQGEFTLTQLLVRGIQSRGILCFAATTRREVVDNPDGTKTSRFLFVRFREYK